VNSDNKLCIVIRLLLTQNILLWDRLENSGAFKIRNSNISYVILNSSKLFAKEVNCVWKQVNLNVAFLITQHVNFYEAITFGFCFILYIEEIIAHHCYSCGRICLLNSTLYTQTVCLGLVQTSNFTLTDPVDQLGRLWVGPKTLACGINFFRGGRNIFIRFWRERMSRVTTLEV
jgi:hypothetical protein